LNHLPPDPYTANGGERGPVIFPAFKAGDSVLSGSNGGFDSHTLPPTKNGPPFAEVDRKGRLPKRVYPGQGFATRH
jgi:hypothetical protein